MGKEVDGAVNEVAEPRENQNSERTESEELRETGIEIYHVPTGSHFSVRAKVRQGEGKVFVNGTPIDELMESGRIKRIEELLEVLSRERLKSVDIELIVGDSQLPEVISPPILTYAIAEAIANLLGRL